MATERLSTHVTPTDAPMIWHGWGDPARRPGLSDDAEEFLTRELGPLTRHTPPVPLRDVRVGESRLGVGDRARLARIVGDDWVRDDHEIRVLHAGGKSYPDLLRRRKGDAVAAPDAVVYPRDHSEVRAVLEACVDAGIAVVPFGGGTSVVGGVEPERGGFDALISLDLARMQRLIAVDETSLTATFEPGLRGPAAEALLRERGLTLGHFPQSYEYATIGGYVATRSAGQASTGYGRIDQLVVGVTLATPAGDLTLGHAPRSAAGPDLRELVVGSEGTLGIITAVTLQVRRAPQVERHEGWVARSFAEGAAVLKELEQEGLAPDITRLSDDEETRVSLAQAGGWKGSALRSYLALRGRGDGCLLILGWEGTEDRVERRQENAAAVCKRHGLLKLGSAVGSAWAHGRFDGPYLRDELMDRGVMVETLETATSWAGLGDLYRAVRGALHDSLEALGTPPLVLCHVSHVYPTGASLYFTWIAQQVEGGEIDQWHTAKTAASAAIAGQSGTITHHHAVGTDHRPWMRDEIGDLGVEALRAVKERFDPTGILNPGKLIPGNGDVLPRHDEHLDSDA